MQSRRSNCEGTTQLQEEGIMLTEQRYETILRMLDERGSVTVTELKDLLDASESTVRRDITALGRAGRLIKVFGGAVAMERIMTGSEPTVAQKVEVNKEEKCRIAAYAAGLIEPEDFIFLDAGTTTGYMLDYLTEKNATFVTNAVAHAQKLAEMGMKVLLVGGELKSSTEAIVGAQATEMIRKYHFTKGFFGANGVTKKTGFTTPEASEAVVKEIAMAHCRDRYVLADHDKFGSVSSVTFGAFQSAIILTDRKVPGLEDTGNVIVV